MDLWCDLSTWLIYFTSDFSPWFIFYVIFLFCFAPRQFIYTWFLHSSFVFTWEAFMVPIFTLFLDIITFSRDFFPQTQFIYFSRDDFMIHILTLIWHIITLFSDVIFALDSLIFMGLHMIHVYSRDYFHNSFIWTCFCFVFLHIFTWFFSRYFIRQFFSRHFFSWFIYSYIIFRHN